MNKGFGMVGLLIAVLLIGLGFVYYIKGSEDSNGGVDRLEEYQGNIQEAEDIKKRIEDRNSVNF